MSTAATPAASRRDFLKKSVGGAAVLAAAPYLRVWGANDRLRLGLIGCGERGRHVMGLFRVDTRVSFTAFCDVFGDQLDKGRKEAEAKDAPGFSDHRKLLELKDVDAVLVATPDHWHAPVTIE